jgi:hypothetical protein
MWIPGTQEFNSVAIPLLGLRGSLMELKLVKELCSKKMLLKDVTYV